MAGDVSKSFYQESLKIDKYNLDEELIKQPVLYQEVGMELSHAISIRDGLKKEMKEVSSRILLSVKSKQKVTESVAAAKVEKHSLYRKAFKAYLAACREVSDWESIKGGYEQRSYALKDLVGLFTSEYYTTTSVKSKETTDYRNEAYESNKQAMDAKRKKRKRIKRDV